MARPLRIEFENAVYHVTCRGNERQDIFRGDADRNAFLGILRRSLETYRVSVLSYVLMANHFHLLVKTRLANLGHFMRHFNITYTAFFNKSHGRSGRLYQGRYKAFLVDEDNYLLEVSRYIHLNPVRVSQASEPADKLKILAAYPWSSFPGYLSPRRRHSFEDYRLLDHFGGDTPSGRRAYRAFVESGIVGLESPLLKGRGHTIVGDEGFIGKIRSMVSRGDREVRAEKAIKRVTIDAVLGTLESRTGRERDTFLVKGSRDMLRPLLMELAYRHAGMNQREIGEMLGIDYSTVSVARKRLSAAFEKDPALRELMESIERELSQG